MPSRAPLACVRPGCPHLAPCADHPRGRWGDGAPGYQRNGWQWQRARARVLDRDGHRCYRCGQPADTVDHVVPVARGGSHDDSNLAAVCAACHAAKTAAERRAGPA